jgi:hypothetical protein
VRVTAAAVLAALLAAGCGAFGGGAEEPAPITDDQIAIMVVPETGFPLPYRGLPVNGDVSGPQKARELAAATLNPRDSARRLKRAGWLRGYNLIYSTRRPTALKKGVGVASAGTSVDLFDTESAAREFVLAQVHDLQRFDRRRLGSTKIRDVATFDVLVGDEAWGVEYTYSYAKVTGHVTGVFFRQGRLVGAAVVDRGDIQTVRVDATSLAETLGGRIERVLKGELQEEPVPLPKKRNVERKNTKSGSNAAEPRVDPKPLTLSAADLPSGTTVTGEGYRRHGKVRSFVRDFRPAGGHLGPSRVAYLRGITQVLADAESAELFMTYAEDFSGSRALARAFARGVLKTKARELLTGPLPTKGPDTLALVCSFNWAGTRGTAVMVLVRSGRVVGSVTGFGKGNEINPRDIIALAPKLRARLRAGA